MISAAATFALDVVALMLATSGAVTWMALRYAATIRALELGQVAQCMVRLDEKRAAGNAWPMTEARLTREHFELRRNGLLAQRATLEQRINVELRVHAFGEAEKCHSAVARIDAELEDLEQRRPK